MAKQVSLNFEFYNPVIKKWFDIRVFPSKEGLSVYFLDITSKKNKSIEQGQYYESLFKNNPDGVYSLDVKGRYIHINKAGQVLLGRQEADIINKSYHFIIHNDELEKTNYHFNEALKGIPQEFESKVVHKNGQTIPIMVTNIPIIIDNQVIGIYGIAKDITLQKVAEESLTNLEKSKIVEQLAASIAHEIKNPLTTLKGFLELAKKRNECNIGHLNIMLSEIQGIESITNELLLLAKPQTIDFHKAEIRTIIEDVITLLQPQAMMEDIEIRLSCEEQVGTISCVSQQIKQVFINIIKNAIESMTDGGIVQVNIQSAKKDHVLIEVIDEGCGIPEENVSMIGLPFYSTKEKGTGLGMLTTYKLVENHGGKVGFESKLDEGTVFKVYLPKMPIFKNGRTPS